VVEVCILDCTDTEDKLAHRLVDSLVLESKTVEPVGMHMMELRVLEVERYNRPYWNRWAFVVEYMGRSNG